MRSFKQFSRNLKAISPIFATLILIAIAVIAGVVVYMFTSGTLSSMTSNTTAGQEKVAVQGVDVTNGAVFAQNMGATDVTIQSVIVKDATGTIVNQLTTGGSLPAGGELTSIPFTAPTASGSYTVTLVSSAGGSFVSSSFVV